MAIKLGELYYQFTSKGFEQTQAQIDKADEKAKKVSHTLGNLKKALLVLGSSAVIYGIKKLVDQFVSYTNEIDKANKMTGISVKTLQELKYAAEQEHASFDQLQKSMVMLTRRMQYVQDGTAEGVRAFDRIGVSATNADGSLRDVGSVFADVAEAVRNAGSETEASAIALELFGRSGAEMVPFLRLGKDEITKLRKEANDLGIVLDEKVIKQGKEFDDTMTAANAALKGVSFTIVKELLPGLKWTATALTNFIKGWRELWGGEERLRAKQIEEQNNRIAASLERYQKWLKDGTFTQEQYRIAVEKLMRLSGQWRKDIDEVSEELVDLRDNQDGVNDTIVEFGKNFTEFGTDLETWRSLVRELNAEYDGLTSTWDRVQLANKRVEVQTKEETVPTTEAQIDVTERLTNSLGTELVNAFQSVDAVLFSNSMTWYEWGETVVKQLIAVAVQLLALTGIVKLLEALGVPAGALLSIGQKVGLYQTPSGDAFAYREGRDFGRFFFQGFREQFNNNVGNLRTRTSQPAPVIIVNTGDPATFVEFASSMPPQYKSKFYRRVTRQGERLEQ